MFKWLESFSDFWGSGGQFYSRRYRSVDGTVFNGGGRYNGNAFQGGNQNDHLFTKILANESPEPDTWVVGFGFKIEDNEETGVTTNDRVVGLTFFTNTEGSPIESQVTLMVERVSRNTYKWELRRGDRQDDTLIATSDPFFANIWNYWELKITIDPSAGAYELRKDGTTFFSGSAVNTASTGTAGADSIGFFLDSYNKWTTTGISNVYLDDIYVLTDEGTGAGNDFVGDCQTERILPISDDPVYTEWQLSEGANHYALVNETTWSTLADDQYIYSEDVGQLDLFGYNPLTIFLTNIQAILVHTTVAMKASGSRKFKIAFNDGVSTPANLGLGVDENIISSVLWDTKSELFETEPVSSTPFTKDILQDYNIGLKMTE